MTNPEASDEELDEGQPTAPLRGRVVKIITNHALAIDLGEAHGVRVGMRFAVLYGSEPELEVIDPETGEPLGSIEYPKVVVKVVKVNGPKLSTARTFRSTGGVAYGLSGITGSRMAAEMLSGTTPVKYESLEAADDARVDRQLSAHDSIVSIGDAVVQVMGDEFDGLTAFG